MFTLTLELQDTAAEDLATAYRAEDTAAFVRDHVSRFLRDDLRRVRRAKAIAEAEAAFARTYDPGDEPSVGIAVA